MVVLRGQQPPAKTSAAAQKAPVPTTVDPNQGRIQEYRDRIDEQVRRLQAEQAELARADQTFTTTTQRGDIPATGPVSAGSDTAPASLQAMLEHDEAQRAYRARYADSLAWTRENESGSPPKVDGRETGVPLATPAPAAGSAIGPALTSALARGVCRCEGAASPR